MLPDECGGRYRDLRSLVTVSDDTAGPSVIVKPKQLHSPLSYVARPRDPDESDLLRILKEDRDRPVIVQGFTPSDAYEGDEWLEAQGERLGYSVMVVGDGPFSCIAKRKAKRSAFDIIKR
jgi:hypothetical protein